MNHAQAQAAAKRIARRRAKDPVRDARRQAHLTRMKHRVVDYSPQYRDSYGAFGEVIASRYLGHVAITAR